MAIGFQQGALSSQNLGYGLPQFSTNSNTLPSGLGDLLGMLQNNKGLFGLGDVATGGLLGFGTQLLGGLGGMLQGKTDAQKEAKSTLGLLKNRLGQDVINPEAEIANIQRSQRPQMQAKAQLLERKFGLDSGVGAGQLAYDQESNFANALLGLRQQNAQLKSQNDNSLLSMIAQLSQAV